MVLVVGWLLVVLGAATVTASVVMLSRAKPHARFGLGFGWNPENLPTSYWAMHAAGPFCFILAAQILMDRVPLWVFIVSAAVLVLVPTRVVALLHNRRLAPPHTDSGAADGVPSEHRPQ